MRRLHPIYCCLLLFVLTACGGSATDENTDDRTVFRYNEAGGISSLDPAQARNLENIWAINQLFNGLVQMDDSVHVVPCIANSWEISEDGKTYTFHLRDDVYFHDHHLFDNGEGRKVVAEDFLFSFWRILDRETASAGASYMSMLDKSRPGNSLGIEAPDDHTVVFYLKKPFPPFLGILTMQYFSVIPHEITEHYGLDFRRNPIGTGPFVFKMWKEDVKLVMLKNQKYWEKDTQGNALPYLDAVAVSFIKDHNMAFNEFIAGKFDFHSGIAGSTKQIVLTQEGELRDTYVDRFRMQKAPYLKTDYLGILIDENMSNVQSSPLRLKKVRQAINYAIDREELIYSQRNGIGTPALAGFVPPGIPSYDGDAVKGYEYNPDKALQLLREAGYGNGSDMPEITLTTTSAYEDLCVFVQGQLKAVDIEVKIDISVDRKARYDIESGNANFFRKSWVGDYLDAENFLQLFYSENWSPDGSNYFHFSNAEFDTLFDKAMVEQNDSTRFSIYQQMDQIVVDEAPVVPLYYDEVVRFIKPEVTGIAVNPMNLMTLKYTRKD